MIQVPMSAAALARSRFVVSPVGEALDGVRALADPSFGAHLATWVRWARPRLRGLDFTLLDAAVRTGGYVPDFLVPVPPEGDRTIAASLAAIRATPPDRVRAELELAYRGRPLPVRLQLALADGEQALLDQLTRELHTFWRVAMQPWWPGIEAALDDDIDHRGRVMARHGAEIMLAQLDRALRWDDACLQIGVPESFVADWADTGVVFAPSVFGGSRIYVSMQPWAPSMIYYPVRRRGPNGAQLNVATARHGHTELLGRTRAAILGLLARPLSTTDLAARLDLSPSTVSYHLGVLYRAGLVDRHRDRRRVVYRRA